MTRRATLRDVAELAGVSVKTISRVVNDSGPVAEETAERVRRAIGELKFQPNPAARSLRVGHDDAVGLVVENIGDPFLATMVATVEARLRADGIFVIVTSGGYAPENERAAVSSIAHRRVAGMIITPTSGSHAYLPVVAPGFPIVFVDRPPVQFETDTVLIDNEQAARGATEHLISYGHRRIAFVGDRLQLFTTYLRHQGFRSALADAGIEVDERIVRTEVIDVATSCEAMRDLLHSDEPPTAVLSANARCSLGVVRALHQEGRSSDLAHVSFDDFDGAESMTPPVTVVYQDPAALGVAAAETLLDRMNGADDPPRHLVLPTRLIVRGSGELRP